MRALAVVILHAVDATGYESFDAHPFGKLALEILNNLKSLTSPSGRNVEFVVEHNNEGRILERLKAEAERGLFKDKHLVVLVCMKMTDEAVMKKFVALRNAALANGAASVLMPTGLVDIPAATLAAVSLRKEPTLLDGATPEEALRRACESAEVQIQRCLLADDKVAAAKSAFGDDGARLLLTRDGGFDVGGANRVLRRLRSLWQTTSLYVLQSTTDIGGNG
ncbi:MAG: hypothetical protein ACRDD1_05105 [Planctomycetia bacterium]